MEIYGKKIKEVMKNKKKIEETLNIKISSKGKTLIISGGQTDEYIAREIFDAVEAGFPIKIALLLAEPDYILEKINIKNLTKRQNLGLIRARIIGKEGGTIELLGKLSDCFLKLRDNVIYIIGYMENIKIARNAVEKLIQGSKQSSVYAYLEKQRKVGLPEDLGLKENSKR